MGLWVLVVYHLHGQQVGLRFGKMVRKIQDWQISFRNHVYHLQKSVKDALEKWNSNFRLEQDYFFKCSVAPVNFPLERRKKPCSIYFRAWFCGNFLLITYISYGGRATSFDMQFTAKSAACNWMWHFTVACMLGSADVRQTMMSDTTEISLVNHC